MGGFESEFEASRSCSWNWSWVTAIGMKRGKLRKERGTMRQRNLNAQCELSASARRCSAMCAGSTGCGCAPLPRLLRFYLYASGICSRFTRFLFSFLSSFFCAFLSFFVRLLHLSRFVWFAQNKLPEVCKCMMQLIRYCLRAWICHGDWLQLCVPKACARPEWGAACTCHSFALQKASPVNKSKRRQRITLRDTCTELNCQLQ